MAALGWITVGCVLIINVVFTKDGACQWLWRNSMLAFRSERKTIWAEGIELIFPSETIVSLVSNTDFNAERR